MFRWLMAAALALIVFAAPGVPGAAEEPLFTVVVANHRFEPAEIEVPANTRFRILVRNQDKTAEEFESHDLKIERIIPGGREATFRIRALAPGVYKFFGEFHPKTAQGRLIVK